MEGLDGGGWRGKQQATWNHGEGFREGETGGDKYGHEQWMQSSMSTGCGGRSDREKQPREQLISGEEREGERGESPLSYSLPTSLSMFESAVEQSSSSSSSGGGGGGRSTCMSGSSSSSSLHTVSDHAAAFDGGSEARRSGGAAGTGPPGTRPQQER